jgi:hypothetical protein
MEYCRLLEFDEEPNYAHLVSLFLSCMLRHKLNPSVDDFKWKTKNLDKAKTMLKDSIMELLYKKNDDKTHPPHRRNRTDF